MPNIRSLTSIKITLNNGHEDFVSPRYGVGESYQKKAIKDKIEKVTAFHFGDSTCFLMFNQVEDELAFSAKRTDQIMMHKGREVSYRVMPTQQIVGIYGYKVK